MAEITFCDRCNGSIPDVELAKARRDADGRVTCPACLKVAPGTASVRARSRPRAAQHRPGGSSGVAGWWRNASTGARVAVVVLGLALLGGIIELATPASVKKEREERRRVEKERREEERQADDARKQKRHLEEDDSGAVTFAQLHVITPRLKAPSTAKFPSRLRHSDADRVTRLGYAYYLVKGWVDAQNAFGAMVRSDWVVKVRKVKHSGGWNPEDWELVEVVSFDSR